MVTNHARRATRLQVFSDIHRDVFGPRPIRIAENIDAVIVAGDVCEGAERGFTWLRQLVPMTIPIVMVLGNHEYYRRPSLREELAHAWQLAPGYGIHLLENACAELAGVRFAGATLWTDYDLFGAARRPAAMHCAASGLNDHRRIKWQHKPWLRFRPEESRSLHLQSRAFIDETLTVPFSGPTVVVTHHAPHPMSLPPAYRPSFLSAAYASDLSMIIERHRPALWVHGHIHASCDYRVGDTRVLSNPHGYGGENPAFDPGLVVEV
jgi:Icc-related predicted phosphoesterase